MAAAVGNFNRLQKCILRKDDEYSFVWILAWLPDVNKRNADMVVKVNI